GKRLALDQLAQGEMKRDIAAGDRRRARAAIGLQDVAVDADLALAQSFEVGDGAQRAADEALDLLRPAALAAARGLAVGARRGGARQHAVFGGDPAVAAVAQARRYLLLEAGGAEDVGVAEPRKARALGIFREADLERNRAKRVVGAAGGAHAYPRA